MGMQDDQTLSKSQKRKAKKECLKAKKAGQNQNNSFSVLKAATPYPKAFGEVRAELMKRLQELGREVPNKLLPAPLEKVNDFFHELECKLHPPSGGKGDDSGGGNDHGSRLPVMFRNHLGL